VNAYEVKAGMVFIAGKTVSSMPERLKVVCIPCKALYKCSALPFHIHMTASPMSITMTTSSTTMINAIIIIYFNLAHQHKAAGMKIRLSKNNDHYGVSHSVECSQEGDHIPPLKSNR